MADDTGDDTIDELPEDLQPASSTVPPYLFPNNNRRRVPGYLYLGLAAFLVALWLTRHGNSPVLINNGVLLAAVLLAGIGAYHLAVGWNLDVDEQQALATTGTTVNQPIGHASAQMAWRGWLSRPTWRILWYSAEDPPLHRGLVLVDGHDGSVVSWFSEDNPEDWTELDGRLDDR